MLRSRFPALRIMLVWLLQSGPKAAKYRGKWHPVATFCVHYAMVAIITVSTHDWMIARIQIESPVSADACSTQEKIRRQTVGVFLGIYFVFYFGCRLALAWHQQDFYIKFYDQTFLCSVTIFNAALGLCTNRPILAESFCVAVGIDHILWYVDLAGKIVLNKFPIGVVKYLFWPGTTWATRLTSTHHLWTIPLVFWASGGAVHFLSLPLSAVAVLVNVLLSRLLTPRTISATEDGEYPEIYLNLNLAYEVVVGPQYAILVGFRRQIAVSNSCFYGVVDHQHVHICFVTRYVVQNAWSAVNLL